jgi:predicted ATPase/DNA-binding SARP family transcriptional activator
MEQRLVVRLLGPPSLTFDGKPWKWSAPPSCLTLLALLAAKREAPATRASLAATMWPDELDTDARANLRRHLHRLLRALPQIEGVEWIASDMQTVAWNAAAPAWIDVRAFEDASEDPARAVEAVDEYRGDLLEGMYDDVVLAVRERLRAVYLNVLARLTREAREARDFESSIRYAEKLLAADEWREDIVRERMAATYESGDRSAALAVYERFAVRLRDEFSAEPMAETSAMRDIVRAGLPLPVNPEALFERQHGEPGTRAWKLPFVGRADVFERLRSAWARAARRGGGIVFVSGEAGIGKSRLAGELVALVRAQGGLALVGTTSNPEAEPYQTMLTALRPMLSHIAHADAVGRPWLSALAQVLPEIASVRPDLDEVAALPEGRARERLLEAFVRVVEQLGALRPVCLVLEDLHWAGPAAIDLLALLARRAGTLPVLVVATYRSEESTAEHPIRALRSSLLAQHRAIAAPLDRLTAADVANVVGSVLDPESEAARSLGEALARLSEGNPLFVAQLLEGYRETGTIPDASSALLTIGDAVAARAGGLDARVRAVAEAAAGIGEAFRADIVADVGGWDEGTVLDAIGALIDRALVREAGSGALEYVFTHALVAASFYERTPLDVRVARHRRTAQVLERMGGDDLRAVSSIARHWKLAGEGARASAAYARAARAALAVHARAEAIDYARQALSLCEGDRRRFDLLQLVIAAEERSEHVEQWNLDLEGFELLAGRLDESDRYAALAARERYYAQTGDRESQGRLLDRMLELALASGSTSRQVEVADARGSLLSGQGHFREAAETFRHALSLAQAQGDRLTIARVRQHLAQALGRSGETAAAARELEELRVHVAAAGSAEEQLVLLWAESSLALATENGEVVERIGSSMLALGARLGDQETQAKAHWLLGWAATVRRDIAGARKQYGDACVLFERLRQPQSLAAAYVNLGVLDLDLGVYRRAIEQWERAAALAEQTGALNVLGFALNNIADAEQQLGNLDRALEMAERSMDVAASTGDQRLMASAVGTLGAVRYARGELQPGIELMRESVELWRAAGSMQSMTEKLCLFVDALRAAGESEELKLRMRELHELYAQGPNEQKAPARILLALAKAERFFGNEAKAAELEAAGRRVLAAESAAFADEESRAAFLAQPHNRELLASDPQARVS